MPTDPRSSQSGNPRLRFAFSTDPQFAQTVRAAAHEDDVTISAFINAALQDLLDHPATRRRVVLAAKRIDEEQTNFRQAGRWADRADET